MITQASNKTQGWFLSSFVLIAIAFTGCTKGINLSTLREAGENLFSNRPTKEDSFFATVKLKTPALLSTATLNPLGRAVVNAEQYAAITKEHEAFVEQLKTQVPNTRIIYRYKMVLNGFSLAGPIQDLEKIHAISQVVTAEVNSGSGFHRPELRELDAQVQALKSSIQERNATKFIGAQALHERANPINGTGVRVGIIDTGIDYTHSMLGGTGAADLFKSIDGSKPSEYFPNKKVVGGMDFVGKDFDSASLDFIKHIPVPDLNPLDEGGHGTHVAGTVAGIGDGVDTYDGVAPGADLYALKVFGAKGSTSDSSVMAAFEFAADPNADGNPDDQLDVVNLSLGSEFGGAKILYNEAVGNLTRGGVVVVASAGNSGNVDYITGAPAVSDTAISVAASIDDGTHNWQVNAVKFVTPTQGEIVAEAVEGSGTKKISEAGDVRGPLVYVGNAATDFTDEVKAQLKGKVALIDRGVVPFTEKFRRANEAGVIGVVVANNQPGAAISMGGEGEFPFPAVMVVQSVGETLKQEITKGETTVQFQTPDKILKPELIDTITDFSSKGPRTEDSLIKPEISAPGSQIISAEMGGGKKSVKMSGTSMAGPQVTGAMALLKQAHRSLPVSELKALLLNGAKTIHDADKVDYPISRQGAGRVQIDRSVDSKILLTPATLSLGEVAIETRKAMRRNVTLRNMSKEPQAVSILLVKRGMGLTLRSTPELTSTLAPGEQKTVSLNLLLDATDMKELIREMDGWIIVRQGEEELARIPVLAVARRVSQIKALSLVVESNEGDAPGAAATVSLANTGKSAGEALLFNLIAEDARKKDAYLDPFMSRACDLQSVGMRIIQKTQGGQQVPYLQIAAKMYAPLTQWNSCEVSVLIDSNNDQVPEQELAAVILDNVPGLTPITAKPGDKFKMASVLFDAASVREIRKVAEEKARAGDTKFALNYGTAALAASTMKPYDHSTIVIVEAPVSKLARRSTGELAIKVAAQEFSGSSVESDDFLSDSAEKWIPISLSENNQSFVGLPERVILQAGETKNVELEKGSGTGPLMVLIPQNLTVFSEVALDQQQFLLSPKFEEPRP